MSSRDDDLARESTEREKAGAAGAGSRTVGPGFWREAGEDELFAELERVDERLTPEQARLLLRNPYLSERIMERLLRLRAPRRHYGVLRDLTRARLTPLPTALALVARLYWRDLSRLSTDVTVRPAVRRQSEQLLLQRLPKLALGERIALARICGPAVVAELRKDVSPRVFGSLLENPRLREGDLLPLVLRGGQPAILELLARNRRWGRRLPIRRALARNPRTPTPIALDILPSLRKSDLRALQNDPAVPPAVKRRCGVLLGEAR